MAIVAPVTALAPSASRRVAIYCRVSTSRQEEEGTSLQSQRAHCERYAAEQRWTVVDVYSDTYSGGDLYNRKGLAVLREAVRNGSYDVVLSYAVDRLARNQAHISILLDNFERHGARAEFVTEKLEDTAIGKFIFQARSFAAELEREKVTERVTRALRTRAEQGKPGGARAPYGYVWSDTTRSRLVIDEGRALVVRRIFEALLAGSTLRGLASALSGDGIPTPWRAAFWKSSTIAKVVANPVYIGKPVALRSVKFINSHGQASWRKRPAEETVQLPDGVAPAIIDEATFTTVQQRLQRNKLESRRRLSGEEAEQYLLRAGHIRCGYCDGAMGVVRSGAVSGRPVRPPLYRCVRRGSSAFARCVGGGMCQIPTALIDGEVWSRVEAVLTQPDVIRRELARLETSDPVADDLAAVARQLGDLSRKRANLVAALAECDDKDSRGALTEAIDKVGEQARRLDAARDDLESRHSVWSEARARIGDVEAWAARIASKLDDATYQTKRDALIWLGVSVRVFKARDKDRWIIEARLPLGEDTLSTRPCSCRTLLSSF
jgi:site-specific DNA recombinase